MNQLRKSCTIIASYGVRTHQLLCMGTKRPTYAFLWVQMYTNLYFSLLRLNSAVRHQTPRWWRFQDPAAAAAAASLTWPVFQLVPRPETSATFWILRLPTVHWWSTSAQPLDPPLSATCPPSGGWWRTSVTWPTSCWCTLMRPTHLTAGWPLPWAHPVSMWGSIRTWRSGWERHANSLSTSLCRHSASWWQTAWTTTLTWRTVCLTNGCASCSKEKLRTSVARGHSFTIWKMCVSGWSRALVNGRQDLMFLKVKAPNFEAVP